MGNIKYAIYKMTDIKERRKFYKENKVDIAYSEEDSICIWCDILRGCAGICPFYDIEFKNKNDGYMKKYGCPNFIKPIYRQPKVPKTLNEAIRILKGFGYFEDDD